MTHQNRNEICETMRQDWNKRAKKNIRKYIALKNWKTEAKLNRSGLKHAQVILENLRNFDIKRWKVLEIGGGIGRIAKNLSPYFSEIYMVDVSEEMIKRARTRLRDYSNIHVLLGNGRDLRAFPDDMFDFVFSIWTFQHLPRKVFYSYIDESHRVLRTGGILIFQIFEKMKISKLIPKYWLRNLRQLNLLF